MEAAEAGEGGRVAHLLVVHVAGASDERGPAFGMELQRRDAVASVLLSGDLRGQNLQAVPGGEACEEGEPKVELTA